MTQDQINQAEWHNPENWAGPDWRALYFSKKDSRIWVPKKKPWMGWTFNFGNPSAGLWLSGTIMGVILLIIVVNIAVFGFMTPGGSLFTVKDSQPPRVIRTSPVNQSWSVDPSLMEISVTFNEEMRDQSWSWAYKDKNLFPQVVGQAFYTDNNTTNVLPVKLEPNKHYEVWVNTLKYNNFKDLKGNSAAPFRFEFKTRGSQ
jgi:hypothetical protein